MTPKPLEPTFPGRAHCPSLDCRYSAVARSVGAALESLEAHIVKVHGSLVQTV